MSRKATPPPASLLPPPIPPLNLPKNASIPGTSELKMPLLRLGSPLILPRGYECVILTGVSSVLLLSWKSMKVAEVRKECRVPNPLTYSENSHKFNCVQRAYHSTLEIYPQFLFLLLTGGLEMPYFSTAAGLIWVLGRYFYAKGYYTEDPANRSYGWFYLIGQYMLIYASLRFAYKRYKSY